MKLQLLKFILSVLDRHKVRSQFCFILRMNASIVCRANQCQKKSHCRACRSLSKNSTPPSPSNELPPHINTTSLIYCGTFIFQYARECRSSTRAGRSCKLQSEFLLIAFVLGINIPHPGIEIRMEVLK